MSLEPNWHLSCTKYLGSREESVQIAELALYCNYFSKKKKMYNEIKHKTNSKNN